MADGNSKRSATGASPNQFNLSTFPSPVAEILIHRVQQLEVLQTLRLVSVQWNEYTMNSLHKNTIVKLNENKPDRVQKFSETFERSTAGRFSFTPFKILEIKFSSFTSAPLVRLALIPKLVVRKLTVDISKHFISLPLRNVQIVLRANSNDLRELVLLGKEKGRIPPSFSCAWTRRLPLLPNLSMLKLMDACSNCSHKLMFRNFFTISKVLEVQMYVLDSELPPFLLSNMSWVSLKAFSITTPEVSSENWAKLFSNGFENLTDLVVVIEGPISLLDEQRMASLVSSVKPNVQSLCTNLIRTLGVPPCPKMRDIYFVSNFNFVGLTDHNFPELHKVTLTQIPADWKCLNHECVPHNGVTHLRFTFMRPSEDFCTFSQNLMFTLASLKHHFPNVKFLDIWSEHLGGFRLLAVLQAYPELKQLLINSEGDMTSVMGIPSNCLTNYLGAGWRIENIPRDASLMDFKDLHTICLGPRFTITLEMIQHCFRNLPSLQKLSFFWNDGLKAESVGRFLSNLFSVNVLGLVQNSEASTELKKFENFNCYYV